MKRKMTKRQLEKRNIQFTIWAKAIQEELKPDEDGEVRAITAIIPSFTSLHYASEIKVFMKWCEENNYNKLVKEWEKWNQ